jgi:hypothetical protein
MLGIEERPIEAAVHRVARAVPRWVRERYWWMFE